MLLAFVFANLGPALSADRRAVRLRAAGVRRLHRLLDGMGLLDRGLGRQRRHRDRVRRVPGRVLAEAGSNNALAAVARLGAIWLLTLVNIAGVREAGIVQVVTTVAEVRAARPDRRRRAVLHDARQLHALRARRHGFNERPLDASRPRPR